MRGKENKGLSIVPEEKAKEAFLLRGGNLVIEEESYPEEYGNL